MELRLQLGYGTDDVKSLGEVKIMKAGQAEGIENRPFQGLPSGARIEAHLLDTICSLSSSEKYYNAIAETGIELGRVVLTKLRDAAFLPAVRDKFQVEQCFKVSLLRESSARELLDSAGVRFGGSQKLTSTFFATIKLDGASAPHEFQFDFEPRQGVPRRMHSIVGLNGVGKTQVMGRLAMMFPPCQNDLLHLPLLV